MQVNAQISTLLKSQVASLGTVKAVADKAGVYPQTISRWINGDVPIIQDKNVPGLARALGLSEIELYSIAHGAGGGMKGKDAADEFQKLAQWLRTQPSHVQEPFIKLAEGFGWKK